MKQLFALITLSMLLGVASPLFAQNTNKKTYRLFYNKPAPNRGSDYSIIKAGGKPFDEDWENWSLPIGNGYFGASLFGRTDTERIQITENSLSNKGMWAIGSLTSFAEIVIDFNHPNPTNYNRSLDISKGASFVQYDYNDVHYSREYFASYPDKVLVIKLKSNKKGSLSFTLRPTIPYCKPFGATPGDNDGRSGKVIAENNLLTLSGHMNFYNIDYEGQIKVLPFGGKILATNDGTGINGKINIENADSVIIIAAFGTNYQMLPRVFNEPNPSKKLAGLSHPHEKITNIINEASNKSYTQLWINHSKDYQKYFSRASVDFGGIEPNIPTDSLLAEYKRDKLNPYLEELYFQYGRYLLICSSRKGTLPANLQGIWSQYEISPWTSGYWHNINVQMNYWPAFNTNLAEMFESYADYNKAFRELASKNATTYVKTNNPSALSAVDGENGWSIGTGASPYSIHSPGGHSGPGTGGFTAKLFWDYYDFTRDKNILKNVAYPTIASMGKFLSKVVKPTAGGFYLANPSSSPEQKVDGKNYETIGCAFDQQMIYENHKDVLAAANLLGYKSAFIDTLHHQLDKLDPVQIGLSGQIKEYREEKKYGDIGEYQHRHISQLVGLYPGTVINSNTPAWLDAARVSLTERGDFSKGWSMAHRMNAWARIKDGERAYILYKTLLQKGTFDNLWDSHPPFQIDGNFGGTAGVAEMMLQSHEGYIAPLAALPRAWESGSFSGLVARGNFEVSAKWKKGQAIAIEIRSKAGEKCGIFYPNIGKAKITSTAGKKVNYTKESDDLIRFSTTKGAVYHIVSIPEHSNIATPMGLQIVKRNPNAITLIWDKNPDVFGYNVYVAFDQSPVYEKVASNLRDNRFIFKQPKLSSGVRYTIKVTEIDKGGRESQGTMIYEFGIVN